MRAVLAAWVSGAREKPPGSAVEALARRARLPWPGRARSWAGDGAALIVIPASVKTGAPLGSDSEDASRDAFGDAAAGLYVADDLALVLDGGLDNRPELKRELAGTPAERAAGDAEIVAEAYRRWGRDCPGRLLGEHAFLLWDRREKHLFGARDALGLREIFHTRRGDAFLAASQLQMLLDRPSADDLDEEYMANFVATQFFYGDLTPFRSVRRLEAGHHLTVRPGEGATAHAFWEPETWAAKAPPSGDSVGAGPDDGDRHAGAFLEKLREAVDRAVPEGRRTWAELSGGFDSSSIVCLAAEVLEEGSARRADFGTLTLVYDETAQSDERRWSRPVAERCGVPNLEVPCDDLFFAGMLEASRYRSEPHFGILCHPMMQAEVDALAGAEVEVLLSGTRAESVVLGNRTAPLHLADQLRRGRIGPFFRELRRWQRALHQPLLNVAYSFGIRPWLHPELYYQSAEDHGAVDPWIDPSFARRMEIGRRAHHLLRPPRLADRAQQSVVESLRRSEQMLTRGLVEWGFEVRHPFLYRPLVETVLQMPWEARAHPSEGKPLLRRALRDHLPGEVLARSGGAGPGPAGYKAFARRWDEIRPVVESSLLVELGYLDREAFTRTAEMVRFGSAKRFSAFSGCLAFEYWLRAVLGEGAPAPAAP